MQTATACTTCGGSGQVIDSKPADADAQGMKTIDETVSIKIPAGVVEGMQLKVSSKGNEAPGNGVPGDLLVVTQSGKILRLRGKGIPSINGYGRGDLLVHVNVWTPKDLNREQKEFFEKMLTDEHFLPKPQKEDKSFFEKVKDMFS